MIEKEILKLLRQISRQLEGIARTQVEIREEILTLQADFTDFQNHTLKSIERSHSKMGFDPLLN